MPRSGRFAWFLAAVVLACEAPNAPDDIEHPPLVWEGERVVVGSDVLEEVCVGTIAWLDATVVSIEAELQLEPSDERIEFVVVDDEVVEELCRAAKACFKHGMVWSSPSGFEYARHELVHARIAQTQDLGHRLFDEGIAAALDKDGGCLANEECSSVNLDALLLAKNTIELSELAGYTYAPGADLVHGMLTLHGPAAVLAFMDDLARDASPEEVRSIYLEHFGSVLDEDFQAFMRGPHDDYTLAQRGCDSLIAITPDQDGAFSFTTTLGCDSTDVVNVPPSSSVGATTWFFEVMPVQSGAFLVIPEDADVELDGCFPPSFSEDTLDDLGQYTPHWPNGTDSSTVVLAPGQYRLRYQAEFGSTIDVQLVPPCNFETAGCPPGEQCTIWNECRPEAETPVALGQPCEQQAEGPLVCEAGSRCLGGVCVAECDSTRPCADGLACSDIRVCGTVCDLLAQDCEPGFNCMPTGDLDSSNAMGLGACVASSDKQYLDNCDVNASECGSGLSCEGVPGPSSSECMQVKGGGCCVPYCDATAAVPDCPPDMPSCDPIRDGPVGICRKWGF